MTMNPNTELIARAARNHTTPAEQSRIERRQFQRRMTERTGEERRSHPSPVRSHYSTEETETAYFTCPEGDAAFWGRDSDVVASFERHLRLAHGAGAS
jgi:hypothetical protein